MSLIDLTNNSQGLDVHIRDLKCRYFTTKLGPISDVYNDVKKLKETEKNNNESLQLLIKDNINEIKDISKEINRIDINIVELQKNTQSYNFNIQNITKIINNLEADNRKLKDINTLLTSYENLYGKMNEDIKNILKIIDNLNNKIENLTTQYEKISLTNQQPNQNTIINDIKKIKEKYNFDNNKINNLTNQIETLSSTNTQLLDQNTLLTSQINSIVTELDRLKKDNERFELQEKYYKGREQQMAQLLNMDTEKL
jgi:chromosome segregation ATPase